MLMLLQLFIILHSNDEACSENMHLIKAVLIMYVLYARHLESRYAILWLKMELNLELFSGYMATLRLKPFLRVCEICFTLLILTITIYVSITDRRPFVK